MMMRAVGRAVARQPRAGGVAHPQRLAPWELHLLATSKEASLRIIWKGRARVYVLMKCTCVFCRA
jgi:hypothetical protein